MGSRGTKPQDFSEDVLSMVEKLWKDSVSISEIMAAAGINRYQYTNIRRKLKAAGRLEVGMVVGMVGLRNLRRKPSDAEKEEIIRRYIAGKEVKDIAADLELTLATIHAVAAVGDTIGMRFLQRMRRRSMASKASRGHLFFSRIRE